jgi:hypothetical protein
MRCPEFVRLIRLRHSLHLHHAIHLAGDNPFGQLEIQAQIAAVITKDIHLKRKKLFPLCGIFQRAGWLLQSQNWTGAISRI